MQRVVRPDLVAAPDTIVARTTRQEIGAGVREHALCDAERIVEDVRTRAAAEPVVPASAEQPVGAIGPEQRIGSVPPIDVVDTHVTDQDVVVGRPLEVFQVYERVEALP